MSDPGSGQPYRRPTAFRLDDSRLEIAEEPAYEEIEDLAPGIDDAKGAVEQIANPRRRGFRWGALVLSAAGALVSLAIGLGVDALIRDLFQRAPWLGWVGLVALSLFVLGLVVVIGRELAGIARLKRVARLRLACDEAAASNDRDLAIAATRSVMDLYSARPETAKARADVRNYLREIMDGRDLLVLAERDLVAPLDARARAMISGSARRVSVVTAVSPRAFLDIIYVLWESVRLIRRVSSLYGGRPGAIGMLRLLRAVLGHLAVTGTIAVGDTILQQVLGHGLAGRISSKLGEGVVNGLMTARIGLSAMDVCRPLPFLAAERPRLKDLAGNLVSRE
ncbi:putative membrane protein [Faunimonas pinastri]|uniref:Putative membrane protein n=1 Tax=Faunimonas pinastri TaxID=1855383 RepID=A0A1H9FCB3_9HYPH|nr:TIGR01620 family protein [Faunimonas pinastri]SEQ35073.1 putative membrane protein [Faunimonas pinastri]